MKFAAAALALAAVASANPHASGARRHSDIARAFSGRDVSPPAGWLTNYLEPYEGYHIRYLAVDCENKHNTTFFADCCHPLLATQSLQADRKAECIPSPAESASAASRVATAAPLSGAAIDPATSVVPTSSAPVNVAPPPPVVTSSSASFTPQPSTTATPTPTSTQEKASSSAAATSSASSSSGGGSGGLADVIGQLFSGGIATFFWQNGVAGACGTVHPDSAFIVALQTSTYANGIHCGKQIVLQDINTGNTQFATVADECPTCDDSQSIDLSHGLFSQFADDALGQFSVQWGFTGQ